MEQHIIDAVNIMENLVFTDSRMKIAGWQRLMHACRYLMNPPLEQESDIERARR